MRAHLRINFYKENMWENNTIGLLYLNTNVKATSGAIDASMSKYGV